MGEARRIMEARKQQGLPPLQGAGRPIEVDLTHAKQIACKCGAKVFLQGGINLFSISAIVSPTGQDLIANKPVMYCAKCFEATGPESTVVMDPKQEIVPDMAG